MNILNYIIIIMFLVPLVAISQPLKKDIQLISDDNNQPVAFAYFVYGTQKGSSNEDGKITINYVRGEDLLISHVSFGKLLFSSDKVEDAFNKGVLIVHPGEPINLQTVTIIALQNHNEPLALSENDKLSHDAGDVLTNTPSVSVIKKAGHYGFDPVLRGFKYDQLNILVDGVQSAVAACPNRMDPPVSHVPLNQMDKIEIYKGPYALRFGPSFGGVINFVSDQFSFGDGTNKTGRISSGYETNGSLYKLEAEYGVSNSISALSIFGSWSEGGDYLDGAGIEVPAQFKRGSFGFKGALKISETNQLNLEGNRNLARNVDFAGLPMDLTSDDTWLLKLKHTAFFDKIIHSWTTSGFMSLVDHMMDNLNKSLDPRMANAWTPANTKSYGGRTEVILQNQRTKTYIGADLKIDEASGYRTREFLMGPNKGKTVIDNAWQDAKISRGGIFVENHLSYKLYHVITSARLDVNQATIQNPALEYTNVYNKTDVTQANPSFSIGINKELGSFASIGLWMGRGQRSGSITERFINYFPVGLDPYELLGNPELDPEINNQIDVNFAYKRKNSEVELSVFSSWLQDFISSEINPDLSPRLPSSPGVRYFTNIKNARLSGFDFSWSQQLPLQYNFKLEGSYVYGKNLVKNEPLPEIPPFDVRLAISGRYINNRLVPEVSFRNVLEQNRISTSFSESTSDDFFLVSLKTSYYINKQIKIIGGVDNLFDKSYYEHLNRRYLSSNNRICEMGRNIYVTLNYQFTH